MQRGTVGGGTQDVRDEKGEGTAGMVVRTSSSYSKDALKTRGWTVLGGPDERRTQ